MTYLLTIGMAITLGCGDQVRLVNIDIAKFATYEECKAVGKNVMHGYRCTKETE